MWIKTYLFISLLVICRPLRFCESRLWSVIILIYTCYTETKVLRERIRKLKIMEPCTSRSAIELKWDDSISCLGERGALVYGA